MVNNPLLIQAIEAALRRRRPRRFGERPGETEAAPPPTQPPPSAEPPKQTTADSSLGAFLKDLAEKAKEFSEVLRPYGEKPSPPPPPPRVRLLEMAEQAFRYKPDDPLLLNILRTIGRVGAVGLDALLALGAGLGAGKLDPYLWMGPSQWEAYKHAQQQSQDKSKEFPYNIFGTLATILKQDQEEKQKQEKQRLELPPKLYTVIEEAYRSIVPARLRTYFSGPEGVQRAQAVVTSPEPGARSVHLPEGISISTDYVSGRLSITADKTEILDSMKRFGEHLKTSYGNVEYEITSNGIIFRRVPVSVESIQEEQEQTQEVRQTRELQPGETEEAYIKRMTRDIYQTRETAQRGTRIRHTLREPVSNTIVGGVTTLKGAKETEVTAFEDKTAAAPQQQKDKPDQAALSVYGIKPPPVPDEIVKRLQTEFKQFPSHPLKTTALVGNFVKTHSDQTLVRDLLSGFLAYRDFLDSPAKFGEVFRNVVRDLATKYKAENLRDILWSIAQQASKGLAAAVRAFPDLPTPPSGSFITDEFFPAAFGEFRNAAQKEPGGPINFTLPITKDALLGLIGFYLMDVFYRQQRRQRS